MGEVAERSPEPSARIIGVVYLLYFLTAAAASFLAKGVVVRDDAAATATRLLAHGDAFRAAVSVGLVANVVYVALTALFYRLF
ncbi:MAG TPA: DUF4386 family protein, partial [Thermoanaerobaculia bacterium]|nr:DUF4386 family protein [Thermoanaerobaculia bacterium]